MGSHERSLWKLGIPGRCLEYQLLAKALKNYLLPKSKKPHFLTWSGEMVPCSMQSSLLPRALLLGMGKGPAVPFQKLGSVLEPIPTHIMDV
jgi:hypothetical protein